MTPLPLTVIGGYLGAGKTTLINRLLAADHGLRLMVLVNDFGAINLDAALLRLASEDTIELSNGCVCCTMGADLFQAVGDVLDRPKRPDHLIVEASGIANPARIANLALAEPDLRFAGIVTVVDGLNFPALAQDSRIGPQLAEQVAVADLVLVSKTAPDGAEIEQALNGLDVRRALSADAVQPLLAILMDPRLKHPPRQDAGLTHPGYESWSLAAVSPISRHEIEQKLGNRPGSIIRLKAMIPDPAGGGWEVHLVGRALDIQHRDDLPGTGGLVAIGLQGAFEPAAIAAWWGAEGA